MPTIEAVFRSGLRRSRPSGRDHLRRPLRRDEDGPGVPADQGVESAARPIDPAARLEPSSGMTYHRAGFPLGGMLSKVTESKGNPEVTITGGLISRLQRDPSGRSTCCKSTVRSSRATAAARSSTRRPVSFFGVAVAKVGSVDTIGFAVTAEEVRRSLDGRVGSVELTLEPSSQQGMASLQVKAHAGQPAYPGRRRGRSRRAALRRRHAQPG